MNILIIGSGGREHALARTLLQSSQVERVVCIPGNGGTASTAGCQNIEIEVEDFEAIARTAIDQKISLIVVGPELPLSLGITDYLQQHNLTVFGPAREGAQIESSKAWAKALMQAANIPTATAAVFEDPAAAKAFVSDRGAPIVIKADGLAAGKGVTVATSVEQANNAIDAAFGGKFGKAGERVVIEECLKGEEVSILALSDGTTIRPLLSARDHKRIGEGDTGENTGGMGAYAPAPIVTPDLMNRIETEILVPAIKEMSDRGIIYRGVLYAGLMITPTGDPNVIEFNCRFGDPETQAILPLLETPLEDLLLATATGTLHKLPPIQWRRGTSACVVMAAGGYPGTYEEGNPITGIDSAEALGAIVFQAGTKLQRQQLLTDGGRVLGVTAVGETSDRAFASAYTAVECIQFAGRYYRRDIGDRIRTKI